MSRKLYLIFIWNGLEPSIQGPYGDEAQRLVVARRLRAAQGEGHGIYKLDVVDGKLEASGFCGAEADE